MGANARLFRSQTGVETEAPLVCTGSPWRLFIFDLRLFFRNVLYLPFIFLPVFPWPSGPLDELYPSAANLTDIAVHALLVVYQLVFLVFLPILANILPFPFFVLYIATVLGLNSLICLHFNEGIPEGGLKSNQDRYSQQWAPHDDEYWIFLNGICLTCLGGTGFTVILIGCRVRFIVLWLACIIRRTCDLGLAIHDNKQHSLTLNRTGVIFDIIQCIIQRSLLYATSDIRDCYVLVKRALYKPGIKKVVLVLHSQGGIEGGMILDWLLEEAPQDLLQHLEVYTFGCLANHFSNPRRNLGTIDPVPSQNTLAKEKNRDHAISYIEHYANAFDFATRWGVLHFTQAERDGSFENRFMGGVFVNPVPGHQLNQHYLDNFFPLDPTRCFTREPREGDFMNMDAQVDESRGDGLEREETLLSLAASRVPDGRDGALNNGTYGNNECRAPKMWECSRLWQYRNGATPGPVS